MPKKSYKFKEYACSFKNEAECNEELEDDGAKLDEAEDEFFQDKNDVEE
jgi:hypothetical protein